MSESNVNVCQDCLNPTRLHLLPSTCHPLTSIPTATCRSILPAAGYTASPSLDGAAIMVAELHLMDSHLLSPPLNCMPTATCRSILLAAGYTESSSLDGAAIVLANTCAIRENAETKVWERLKFLASVGRKRRVAARQRLRCSPLAPVADDVTAAVTDEVTDAVTAAVTAAAKSAAATAMDGVNVHGRGTAFSESGGEPVNSSSSDGGEAETAAAAAAASAAVTSEPLSDLKVGVLGCMAERLKAKLLEGGLVDVVAGPDAYRDLPRLLELVHGDGDGAEPGGFSDK